MRGFNYSLVLYSLTLSYTVSFLCLNPTKHILYFNKFSGEKILFYISFLSSNPSHDKIVKLFVKYDQRRIEVYRRYTAKVKTGFWYVNPRKSRAAERTAVVKFGGIWRQIPELPITCCNGLINVWVCITIET